LQKKEKKEMSPKPFFVFVWRLKTSICWKAICLTYFAINKIWSSITQEDAELKMKVKVSPNKRSFHS